MDTASERKPSVCFNDDYRPALNIYDYVKVSADTFPGHNRHEGYGFIMKACRVGAATLFFVQFSFCVNNQGRTIQKISLKSTTQANFQDNYLTDSKRKRTNCQLNNTSQTATPQKNDTQLPILKLLDSMANGGRTKKKRDGIGSL